MAKSCARSSDCESDWVCVGGYDFFGLHAPTGTCRRRGELNDECWNAADCNSWLCSGRDSQGTCQPASAVIHSRNLECRYEEEDCRKPFRDNANRLGWDNAAEQYYCTATDFMDGYCMAQGR